MAEIKFFLLKMKNKQKKNNKQFILQTLKGMRDILPADYPYWEKVEKAFKKTAEFYNFKFIEPPILERAELFIRGTGVNTDIVEKELYTFKTKGKDLVALRPEFTPSLIRAYIEHGMSRLSQPVKMCYFGPVFRYSAPQAGRFRQFYQAGLEIIGGEADPIYDAQIIVSAFRFIEELKIKKIIVQLNSIGCRACRPGYRKKLQEYYRRYASLTKTKRKICKDCERRIKINPLRVLDCKNELCQQTKENAPVSLDYLCLSCRSHFKGVLEFLDEISFPYVLSPHLVRGLDYYNRTVFEIIESGNPSLALAGGGRYDYLAESFGKRAIPSAGVSLGVERIIEVLKSLSPIILEKTKDKVFIIHAGELAKKKTFALIEEFRKTNIKIFEALGKESLESQLKAADREETKFALIIGQKEFYEESIILKDMENGVQETVSIKKIVEEVKKRLKD